MKKTILVGLLCGAVVGTAAILKKEKVVVDKIIVSYPDKKKAEVPQIPVKVTLTKYQLQKMLNILEDESDLSPADPQDIYTFTSVARGRQGEYTISSTHLSRK